MFDPQWIYSVFEDVATSYLRQALEERHYGEAMLQLSALPKQTGFVRIRNKLVKEIQAADSYEQDTWLTQMSLLIGQYNRLYRYEDGIWLAENYIRYFLNVFELSGHMKTAVPFWLFDTNFYLLTMYDHLGNTAKCQEHLQACRERISVVNRSWEHIDYYFNFCIRELNVLMGRFAFDEVIRKADQLEQIFIEARDLFRMIKTYNGTKQPIQSELLGKVYGVKLEALINKMHGHPEVFDTALDLSDKALAEFSDPRDISRQYQWRCLLMVEKGNVDAAYKNLLMAVDTDKKEKSTAEFVEYAYNLKNGTYDFLIWHYTNVMLLCSEKNDPRGAELAEALMTHPQFKRDIADQKKVGHPWNLIMWNLARYYRLKGNQTSYDDLYQRAVNITCMNKANVTMMTFALSMSADRLLWYRQHGDIRVYKAQTDLLGTCVELEHIGLTDEMRKSFRIPENGTPEIFTDELLIMLSKASLK